MWQTATIYMKTCRCRNRRNSTYEAETNLKEINMLLLGVQKELAQETEKLAQEN